jgi:hypothetical protein
VGFRETHLGRGHLKHRHSQVRHCLQAVVRPLQ